jgi:hypothetical protein
MESGSYRTNISRSYFAWRPYCEGPATLSLGAPGRGRPGLQFEWPPAVMRPMDTSLRLCPQRTPDGSMFRLQSASGPTKRGNIRWSLV